jgi:hypothetical protein
MQRMHIRVLSIAIILTFLAAANSYSQTNTFPNSGSVGIGTINPNSGRLLHVTSGNSGDAIVRIEADADNNDEFDNPWLEFRQDGLKTGMTIGFDQENLGGNIFGISARYSSQQRFDTFVINTANGNVGIGTTDPTAKLAIDGDVKAKEVLVTEQSYDWPDYVFDAGYRLPDLPELEQFIQTSKHLPGIPSAAEIEQGGQNLGALQAQLLQKIEELTLYVIELEKKHRARARRIERLEQKLEELSTQQ